MVDSETTAATGGLVDSSVGSIVWVRRRNGSWWPGKILGPDDLSSSLITSPRSGTPVKLLGREDASVDWYNLEKSKRVKSFRCGDFDECIERAEASQGMPPKKREKYARREDAILHALELEKQMLEKKYGKLGYPSNGRYKKSTDAISSGEHLEKCVGNQNNSRSDQISERLPEKNVTDILLRVETGREESQVSGDDDSPGALPRMRGLQDFGLLTAPPREEFSGVAFRSKRSRYAYLHYDSGDSSHDNRVQPSRLQTTASKFDGSGYLVNAGEDHISGSTEDTETDCSETDSLESDSDDDMMALSDGSLSIELQPKYPSRFETFKEHGSMSSTDDFDGFTSADDASHPFPYDPVSTSTGMSKWQLKGKRNSRILGKRSVDITDPDMPSGYINGKTSNWSTSGLKADLANKSGRIRTSRQGTGVLQGSDYDYTDVDGLTWNSQSGTREYWEDLQEHGDTVFAGKHHMGGRIMLVDVDMKVKANNYRRDVPMISLTSKLNGHSIIGHPIQVEALENGSTDKLLKAAGYFSPESLESPTALRPVWRTGRRTANSRVPRPRFVDENKKHGFLRNSVKKTSPSSNQKIRTLSSIPLEQKHHNNLASGAVNAQVDELIKTVPTAVACIPVKLVFSRLHEELVDRHQ